MKLGILASHPVQYQGPLFRALARRLDLHVFFAHRQSRESQADAGFGIAFDWDVDLLEGYCSSFLDNIAARAGTDHFFGCNTPGIRGEIAGGSFDAFAVMGWHLYSYFQAILACKREHVPILIRGDSQLGTPRGAIKRAVKALIYPVLLSQFDRCLYVGKGNREYLEHYSVPDSCLFFSPHCVDNEFFASRAVLSDRACTRAWWGIQPHQQAVLFVGKLIEVKRPLDMVRALCRMRGASEPLVGVFVGDGPLRSDIEALGKELDVPLVFLGFRNQTELPAIYAGADVLVLPSTSETWGLVVNEALASGLPCVVADTCGCAPDLVKVGVTGSVFRMGDSEHMAQQLATVLAEMLRGSEALAAHINGYSVDAAADGFIAAMQRTSIADLQ